MKLFALFGAGMIAVAAMTAPPAEAQYHGNHGRYYARAYHSGYRHGNYRRHYYPAHYRGRGWRGGYKYRRYHRY